MNARALALRAAWSAATATSHVVRGVVGAVAPGEVLCVIGRNGVGKSTLMKLLFGQLPCREGTVRFEGADHRAPRGAQRRALGISYCPQERSVFDELERARQPHA